MLQFSGVLQSPPAGLIQNTVAGSVRGYVPDARVAWRDAWIGALVTAALFAIGRSAIGYYLGRGAIDTTYGAAASLVAVVFWVYYSTQILYFGAELTQVLGRSASGRARPPKPGAEPVTRVVRRNVSARPAASHRRR